MRKMLATIALTALVAACGTEDPTPEQPGDDGKYHAPASGEHTTETLACSSLVDGHGKQMLSLGCISTSRTCPGFLRTQFGADCLEYDKGSVDGCLAYFKTMTTCQDLSAALDGCVITSYPGTAPAGCP